VPTPNRHSTKARIRSKDLLPRATRTLFAEENRGLLLDISVFVANVFLMRLLTGVVIDLFRQVSAEKPLAKLALGLACLGMWILPAAGAVLKRWPFHQRLKAQGRPGESKPGNQDQENPQRPGWRAAWPDACSIRSSISV
jgi:hypothetical protein